MTQFAKETLPISLEEEMRRSYLDYAMSVIVGRALPDARDGLKPVHRRVLFAMHELNNDWNRPYKKSARIVGDVIGKYHPHGDQSVYDTIVRMAQDFSLRHMLVDGQGNFGSVDGDNAAAMRYTEIRLAKIAHEMLADIDKETVDFGPNYDGSEKEPLVLPARLPNLLINGSAGIAVGMATNIPPHNLNEVVDACLHSLKNPDCSVDELMEIIPAPDFPTKIQRPTVLSWAFSFVLPACHAGFPHILRVRPGSCGLAGTSPVALRSALSSLEIGANFFAVAHADGVVRQPLMRAPTGMVGSRVCTSKAEGQTREACLHVSPWAEMDRHRSCCAHGSGRSALG